MAATIILGKLLIITALCFQAYLLFADNPTIKQFNTNTAAALAKCDWFPQNIVALLKQHLRLAVVVLLASSILMLFRTCVFKITVLIGLLASFYVENHIMFTNRTVPSVSNDALWQRVAVIGAVVYLIGVDCSCEKQPKKKYD